MRSSSAPAIALNRVRQRQSGRWCFDAYLTFLWQRYFWNAFCPFFIISQELALCILIELSISIMRTVNFMCNAANRCITNMDVRTRGSWKMGENHHVFLLPWRLSWAMQYDSFNRSGSDILCWNRAPTPVKPASSLLNMDYYCSILSRCEIKLIKLPQLFRSFLSRHNDDNL